MGVLKEASEQFGFKNVWTCDGQILLKMMSKR